MTRIRLGVSLATIVLLTMSLSSTLDRTGVSSAARLPKPPPQVQQKLSPAVDGAVVSRGIVYVAGVNGFAAGTGTHYVYALRAATGKLVWRYQTGNSFNDTPLVAGGTVYVGSGDQTYALNAATGRLRWRFRTRGFVGTQPALAGGVLIVCAADGHVYGLRASSGAMVWRVTLGPLPGRIADDDSSDPPAIAGGTVFIPNSTPGVILALDAATGRKRWSYTAPAAPVSGSTAAGNGMVYFPTGDQLIALRATNGKKVWSAPISSGFGASSPAVAGGSVFLGSRASRVYAFKVGTGAREWTFKTSGAHGCTQTYSPVASGGIVYVGSDDFNLYALKAATGKQVWRHHTGNEVAAVAVAGRSVYAWSLDGNEYRLNASNGRTQWRFHIGGNFPHECVQ